MEHRSQTNIIVLYYSANSVYLFIFDREHPKHRLDRNTSGIIKGRTVGASPKTREFVSLPPPSPSTPPRRSLTLSTNYSAPAAAVRSRYSPPHPPSIPIAHSSESLFHACSVTPARSTTTQHTNSADGRTHRPVHESRRRNAPTRTEIRSNGFRVVFIADVLCVYGTSCFGFETQTCRTRRATESVGVVDNFFFF